MTRTAAWFGAVLGLLLLFSACTGPLQQGKEVSPGTKNEKGYRFRTDSYRYMHDDGEFGVKNSNPNLAIGEWSNSSKGDNPTRRMRQAAEQVEGVQDVRVNVTGGHAALQVTPERNVPSERYGELQEKVLRRVSFEMPRYEIRVRVGRSKWNPLRYLPFAQ
ncbi:hypothetical protein [Paludifilum halophilum]|uniref:Sporulation protein n=1 Tax=Paludifilum halophilum TaxID=1642702 RepID=A0A235B6R3_9BACL|nr:hypothetical protein [Paludifilum halophilum]OYD07993.1 hypothetical protein CHM34_07700 [Paludifilum halophilum]